MELFGKLIIEVASGGPSRKFHREIAMTDNATPSQERLDQFEAKFMPEPMSGCWLWIGAIQSKGYGNYQSRLAHRVSYERSVGKIPDGLTLDHRCRVTSCVNPAHLTPMTQKKNNSLGYSPTALNARKTHCSKGHEFTPENTRGVVRDDGNRRYCKTCNQIWKKASRETLKCQKIN